MLESQAALAKRGSMAGIPATPAKRAKLVTPIMGEMRTRRSGRGRALSPSASSAYIIASAPPFENPTMCSGVEGPARLRASRTASRVAACHSSHSTVDSAAGTVPWAGRRGAIETQPAARYSRAM